MVRKTFGFITGRTTRRNEKTGTCVRNIWLSAVTAEVRTVVEIALVGTTKLPAPADLQSAGPILDAHFFSVPKGEEACGCPLTLQTVPSAHAQSTERALLAISSKPFPEAV